MRQGIDNYKLDLVYFGSYNYKWYFLDSKVRKVYIKNMHRKQAIYKRLNVFLLIAFIIERDAHFILRLELVIAIFV